MGFDSDTNETDLLLGLQAGDEVAYCVLLDLYESAIYRFFVFEHGDPEMAEDQTCETFAAMVKAAPRLEKDTVNLRAYLYGIARNVKRSQERKRIEIVLPEEMALKLAGTTMNARQELSQREEIEQAIRAVSQLDEPGREIILLRYVEEMSLAQVADAMGMPLNSVKSQIRRNLQELRSMLDREQHCAKEINHVR